MEAEFPQRGIFPPSGMHRGRGAIIQYSRVAFLLKSQNMKK